ncbi:MAG: ribonuclease HII [Leptolyngbya foveolarum]|uniref:Ribonuclease HII n=1 Tax=Leptolyngbya foveolarum TaxID=47253 RepID=A0A2W4UPM8_9CYAN|nr:MAG: ribonuclease HII [Leptolyngbya foveolarum]
MSRNSNLIAGVDEVGRGALFGPVVAAAVILPDRAIAPLATAGVTDSKKLSAKRRQHLAQQIRQVAHCAVGMASVYEIDRINILQASLLAMRRAVSRLVPQPDFCLVDGNQPIPQLPMEQQTVIKGDLNELAIAAASIVAKVWRDELITRLDSYYPGYDLASNKGYGSAKHLAGIETLGITRQHRTSFKSCQLQVSIRMH